MPDPTRPTKPGGSWKRRALVFVAAALVSLLSILGGALYLLDDDGYRHVLIWSADYFLDSQLEIEGAFSIRFAREVELNAEKLHLKANDGSYDLSLDGFYLQQRFTSYLRSGSFWINKLSVDSLQAEITATPSEEAFDWRQLSIPPVVIEETRIGRLSLNYRDGDQQHAIELHDIVLDDENNQGPIRANATGVMNLRPLAFAATLGSLAQLRNSEQDFPVEFSLRSAGAG